MNQRNIGYLITVISVVLLVLLGFMKADIDNKDAFLCATFHSLPDADMTTCPVHTSNSSWLITLAFGVGFLFLGVGLYMVFSPKIGLAEKKALKKVDLAKLEGDEKKICRLLQNNEGSMYQSDLIKDTDFSKVRMTRVLDKLEQKGILERKRRGMTNIIVLK